MNPNEYGLDGRKPEAYAAIAVHDLIEKHSRTALHIEGELTIEYLGMLSLFALHRAHMQISAGGIGGNIAKWAYENFDPNNLSDALVSCLRILLTENK